MKKNEKKKKNKNETEEISEYIRESGEFKSRLKWKKTHEDYMKMYFIEKHFRQLSMKYLFSMQVFPSKKFVDKMTQNNTKYSHNSYLIDNFFPSFCFE